MFSKLQSKVPLFNDNPKSSICKYSYNCNLRFQQQSQNIQFHVTLPSFSKISSAKFHQITNFINNKAPYFKVERSFSNLQVESAKFAAKNYHNDIRYQIELLEVLNNSGKYDETIKYFNQMPPNLKYHSKIQSLHAAAVHETQKAGSAAILNQSTNELGKNFSFSLDMTKIGAIPLKHVTSGWDHLLAFLRILFGILILSFIFMRLSNNNQQQGGVGGLSMLQSNHKKFESTRVDVKFSDVLGIDEIKDEIMVYVEYLKNPNKFIELGAQLPKGVLLTGDPGTGKTLIARAIAGESGVPFYFTSGSSFDEIFVGVGPRRVRELMEEAKKNAPCIVFIDEIDSIGSSRSSSRSYRSKDGTLNQLLSELDGFEKTTGVVIIGATNLPDKLDEALVRPGRFDRIIRVPKPDIKGRKDILDFYLNKVKTDGEIDTNTLARTTIGMTGAELSNIVNLAALKAVSTGKSAVNESLLEEAYDDTLMGAERKSYLLTEEGKRKTAFHEAGHALCSYYLFGVSSIRKVTIVPRGQALGLVARIRTNDDERIDNEEIVSGIVVALGGRVGEMVFTGNDDVTTGASNDFEVATQQAKALLLYLGTNEKIGPVVNSEQSESSPKQKYEVDQELFSLIHKCYKQAEDIIKGHEREHHLLVEALEKYETVSGEEVGYLFDLLASFPKLSNEQLINKLRESK